MRLESQRIKLRKLDIGDAKFILANAKDKEVIKYTYVIPPPFNLRKVKEFIKKTQKEIREKTVYEFGIELKESRKLVGTIKLSDINYKNKNANVGFWVSPKYWSKGLAKEALNLILDSAFKKLNLNRIQARVLHRNTKAKKLLEKSSFKLEGKLREKTFFKNKWYDDLIYGILKKEYHS